MGFWKDKKVLVTGGSGFLGSHLLKKLHDEGAKVIAPTSKECDLRNLNQTVACFEENAPEIIIHLAASYGGIDMNYQTPASIFFDNLLMSAHIFEASQQAKVKKLVFVGTGCAYPGNIIGKMKEEEYWNGKLHPSVENYGSVKKIMEIAGRAYETQHGLKSIHPVLANLYGPGDTFHEKRAHVASALIRRYVEAEQNKTPVITNWGSGSPVREFLYVEDCVEGILLAAEKYDKTDLPLNIGTGVGTSIKELAETICDISGYSGAVEWDTSKPDGAKMKLLDVGRMEKYLGWKPKHDLRQGMEKTIAWYKENKEAADRRL